MHGTKHSDASFLFIITRYQNELIMCSSDFFCFIQASAWSEGSEDEREGANDRDCKIDNSIARFNEDA